MDAQFSSDKACTKACTKWSAACDSLIQLLLKAGRPTAALEEEAKQSILCHAGCLLSNLPSLQPSALLDMDLRCQASQGQRLHQRRFDEGMQDRLATYETAGQVLPTTSEDRCTQLLLVVNFKGQQA